jgi:hypothetical protein
LREIVCITSMVILAAFVRNTAPPWASAVAPKGEGIPHCEIPDPSANDPHWPG